MIEKASWKAETTEQFYEDYYYYVSYNILMYGEDAWMVPYGRFVKEYPRWCPVWKLDLTQQCLAH